MNNIYEKALSSLIKGVVNTVTLEIKRAKFNRGITGRITGIIDSNTYTVTINDKEYTAKSRFNYQINNVVKIICWNNNMNELYVIY